MNQETDELRWYKLDCDEKGLNTIAEKVLGVSLESIEHALK